MPFKKGGKQELGWKLCCRIGMPSSAPPESPVRNINTLTQTCICYPSSLVSRCTKEWIYDSRSLCYAPNGAVVENNDAFCQANKCINQANGLIYSVMVQQEPGMASSWKFIRRKVLTQFKECFTYVPGYIGMDGWTQEKYCTLWEFCRLSTVNHWEGWRITWEM